MQTALRSISTIIFNCPNTNPQKAKPVFPIHPSTVRRQQLLVQEEKYPFFEQGFPRWAVVVFCWCWPWWQRAFDAWSVTELPTSRASDLHEPGRWKVISGQWWTAEPGLVSSEGPAVLIKISDVWVTLALLPGVWRDRVGQDRWGGDLTFRVSDP